MPTVTPRTKVTVDDRGLRALIRFLPGEAKVAVAETASEIRMLAAALAAIDTGSMAASIYITNGEESDYSQAAGNAKRLNPAVVIVPEVQPEFALSLSGGNDIPATVVGVAAGHGIYNEYGTRFMASQPFLTPAAEQERDEFVTRMTQSVNKAISKG